jgi:RNA polymerase sigma factor (sigma-70 family)
MRSQEENLTLFNSNKGLAITIASAFFGQDGYDREDIKQEAQIALWDACRYFKPEKGEFKVFAGVAIRQRLQRYMGKRTDKPLPLGEEEMLLQTPARKRRVASLKR